MQSAGDEDDIICLDESFFINNDYQLTSFRYGDQELELFCLQSASTDYDHTGQLVWPGAELLNNYLSNNKQLLHGRSIIELGSGVGVTGLLASRFCREIVLTDHNDEVIKVLKKNIDVHSSGTVSHADLFAEKLEWGNHSQLKEILERHPGGFDLIFGADISASVQGKGVQILAGLCLSCQDILGEPPCPADTVSVFQLLNSLDELVIQEATRHGLQMSEVQGTRSKVGNHEGVIFEFTIHRPL